MDFGMQMRILRAVRGLNLAAMQSVTGIDAALLSVFERGMRMSDKHLGAILTGYGFPPEELRELAFGILEGEIVTVQQAIEALAAVQEGAEVAQ
jgi:transcriptional regulator with XRE-family HTH domain